MPVRMGCIKKKATGLELFEGPEINGGFVYRVGLLALVRRAVVIKEAEKLLIGAKREQGVLVDHFRGDAVRKLALESDFQAAAEPLPIHQNGSSFHTGSLAENQSPPVAFATEGQNVARLRA